MKTKVPRCIAIVPDGNRRWGGKKGISAHDAHRAGAEAVRTVAEHAFRTGVEHVVVWAASMDNIRNRGAREIKYLAELLKEEIRHFLKAEKCQLSVCGFWKPYIDDPELESLVLRTANLRERRGDIQKHFTILFCYDGPMEIEYALGEIAGRRRVPSLYGLRQHSTTAHVPSVDILIRTLGDGVGERARHVPILPLCMTPDTMLEYPRIYWPDFTIGHLDQIVERWACMQRRGGA